MNPGRTTLADAKSFGIGTAIGIIDSDPRFVRYLNEAIMRLAYKGPWVGAIQRMRICLDTGNCIICPKDVINLDAVLAGCEIVPVRNMWYEYLGAEINPNCECGCNISLMNRGFTPFPRTFTGPDNICIYNNPCDAGLTVLLQGKDQNGKPIRSQYPADSGKWENGVRVVLGDETTPFTCTQQVFSSLTGIQKDETTHSIQVYPFSGKDDPTRMIAEYGPYETRPQYLRYELCGNVCTACEPCSTGCDPNECSTASPSIVVLARLGPVPVREDSDYLLIGNLPALKDMMMAIRYAEENDPQRAGIYEVRAINQLKAEKIAHSPSHQRSVNVSVMGTAPFERVMCGFI